MTERLNEEVIGWRRDLHAIPEVGFDLPKTSAYVESVLRSMGLDVRRVAGGSGLIAEIAGTRPGRVCALRADMDALPIREETGLPFASVNGAMHACGHDGHTAMLLGAARLLTEDRDFSGTVRLLFQPAEEGCGGARAMVADGAMDGVDGFFGMHAGNLADAPAGRFSFRAGTVTASYDSFTVDIRGKGCHGARPEDGVDPIVVSAAVITALQTLASREHKAVDPMVFTIGTIEGGTAENIIPDTVTMTGCMRTCDPDTRAHLKRRAEALVRGVAAGMGAEGTVRWRLGSPPTVNDPAATDFAASVAADLFGRARVERMKDPIMVSEDAAEYGLRAPGCFWLYATPGTHCRHHAADFDLDESLLADGSRMLAETARRFLNRNMKQE